MVIHLSIADLIVMVGFSALVGLALGMAVWRPTRRERAQTDAALALQESMRERASQRLEAARDQERLDYERYRAAFFAPFESAEENRRG